MNRTVIGLLLACFLGFSHWAFAQQADSIPSEDLVIKAIYHQGNILLRWAPTQPAAWSEGNHHGYILERKLIDLEGPSLSNSFKNLTPQPLKPQSQEAFRHEIQKFSNNSYVLVAGECIYGQGASSEGLEKGWVDASDQLHNRFSLCLFSAEMNFKAAEFSGLGFRDEGVTPNKRYLYKLSPQKRNGKLGKPVFILIDSKEKTAFAPTLNPAVEAENQVILSWNRKRHEKHFSAYWIEKSDDGENWYRLNQAPYVHAMGKDERVQTSLITYRDSVSNYKPAWYRIVGINSFGIESPDSSPVLAMGRDKTPPPPISQVSTKVLEDGSIQIDWEADQMPGDLAGFMIKRAFDFSGPSEVITSTLLSAGTSRYTDPSPNFVGINYYQVVSVDTAGNQRDSKPVVGFVEDHEPPSKPQKPIAVVDSLGHVVLSWETHPAPDVKGYKIFFANHRNEHFALLSQALIKTTQFHDTLSLNSLSESVYYRLVAVDRRGNTSLFSDWTLVKRPDIHPPARALFRAYEATDRSITLNWIPSSSRDAVSQIIERKSVGKSWEAVEEFSSELSTWTDEKLDAFQGYSYRIVTVDDDGLKSYSQPLRVKTQRSKGTPELTIRPRSEKKLFQLSWEASNPYVGKWILYRAIDEKPLQRVATLDGNAESYQDSNVQSGVSYRYALRAVYSDGAKSSLGDSVLGTMFY